MKFRPPERLEKWIAYDGALGAELLIVEAEAPDNADSAAEFTFVAFEAETADDGTVDVDLGGFDVSHDVGGSSQHHDGKISVSLEDGAAAGLLPYLRDTVYDSEMIGCPGGNDIDAGEVYVEISTPDGGDFGFIKESELSNWGKLQEFLDSTGMQAGDRIMLLVDDTHVREFELQFDENGKGFFDLVDIGGFAEVRVTEDGGIGFHALDDGNDNSPDQFMNLMFRSIAFTQENTASPVSAIGGFTVSVYHKNDWDAKSLDTIQQNVDDPNYAEEITGGSAESESEYIPPIETDPDPGGEDLPFTPPGGDDGGIDDGGEDGGEEGDDGGEEGGDESGDDAGGEGDSGSDSGQGDGDPGVVFEDGYADADEDGSADDSEAEAREDVAPVDQRGNEERAAENAADARQLELARDMEFMLTAVRNERAVLLGLIGRLQAEYLAREPMEYGELRGYLRRLFDMGGREQETVNRIIDAMNREMDVFRGAAPGRRDGMLAESVRELIDSAERHSGEMGAYSQAIEAVADLLAARRNEGLPPPSEPEVAALFAAKYEEAMSGWLADAARIDPMGRELTAARRTQE